MPLISVRSMEGKEPELIIVVWWKWIVFLQNKCDDGGNAVVLVATRL